MVYILTSLISMALACGGSGKQGPYRISASASYKPIPTEKGMTYMGSGSAMGSMSSFQTLEDCAKAADSHIEIYENGQDEQKRLKNVKVYCTNRDTEEETTVANIDYP